MPGLVSPTRARSTGSQSLPAPEASLLRHAKGRAFLVRPADDERTAPDVAPREPARLKSSR